MSTDFVIRNVHAVTPAGVSYDVCVEIHDGYISNISDSSHSLSHELVIDGQGGWVVAGFIDLHVHGGYGFDFMDGTVESLEGITRFHMLHGTTTMLATTVTSPLSELEKVMEVVESYRSSPMPYARLAGVHLEGPFINENWAGAQNPAHIVPPDLSWLKAMHEKHPQLIKLLTLAPEKPGAAEMISWMNDHHIVAALGHTAATYEQVLEAAENGLRHAVHTYNAMQGMHHRDPGCAGAVLTDPRINAEIIADGHHVHPTMIHILASLKPEQTIMITDAVSAAGLGNGEYKLGGLEIVVHEGVARLKEGDSLAGSTLTMINAFKYMIHKIGLPIEAVSLMASLYPAQVLNIDNETGSLEVGKRADLLLLDQKFDIRHVWIDGKQTV